MSRTDQRRRRALRAFAPVAGLLAVGLLVWQGSYAAFSATTNNSSEGWSSGQMTLLNDGGAGTGVAGSYVASTTALFNETLIKPGDTKTRCLTVKAGGTLGGTLNLYRGAITALGTGAAIAPQLSLVVVATAVTTTAPLVSATCASFPAGGNTTVSPALMNLNTMPQTYATGLGSIVLPAGVQYVTYKIQYTFTSTAADNTFQDSSAAAVFNWEMQ